jgi:hypothetical protein
MGIIGGAAFVDKGCMLLEGIHDVTVDTVGPCRLRIVTVYVLRKDVRKPKVLNEVQLINCWLGSLFSTERRARRTCPSTFPWTYQHFYPIRIKCHMYTFLKITIYQPMAISPFIFLTNWIDIIT